jgi:PAS domain S-box-containing protein
MVVSRNQQTFGFLQAELRVLLESMPEAVFIFDKDGVVAEVNAAGQRMFGQNRGDLHGLSLAALMHDMAVEHNGNPLRATDFAVNRALQGESIHHEQRVYIRAGAEPMDAIITAQPMRVSGSTAPGALVIIRDVTELYNLQRRLEDTERYLAIGQMAADIAHDLNNVLSTISQAATVVEQQKNASESDRRFFLAMIQNAVRRGSEIIQRMREYIRGGKGERLPVDVAEILREALDLTRPLLATRPSVQLRTDMPPSLMVLANAADLRRSFSNIIFNAIEAMPRGGVLKVSCMQDSGRAVVAIEDTGVGISPEARSHIFSPYYTTKAKGTGLGLSGARRIVQAHGGEIQFESEPNRGTLFLVYLPLMKNEKEAAA